MDSNGSRNWLLLGPEDWGACVRSDLAGSPTVASLWPADASAGELAAEGWDADDAELMLPREAFRFRAAPLDIKPGASRRRGAAADADGNVFWVDVDGSRILRQCAQSGQLSVFWPPERPMPEVVGSVTLAFGPDLPLSAAPAPVFRGEAQPLFGDADPLTPPPPRLAGLAMTPDHRLIAGSIAPAGLLDFDLVAGGPPRWLAWPEAAPGVRAFMPCDIAADVCGVWILDRALPTDAPPAAAVDARLWRLDRRLASVGLLPAAPVAETGGFGPQGGDSRALPPAPRRIDFAHAIALNLRSPIAVESLPDCRAIVLDNPLAGDADPWGALLVISPDPLVARVRLSLDGVRAVIADEDADAFRLAGHALLAAAPTAEDRSAARAQLWVVGDDGNQAFRILLVERLGVLSLEPLPEFLPMRRYGGRGLVAVAAAPRYDSDGHWVPLVVQKRPRYSRTLQLDTWPGSAARPPFDAGEPGCVWHRVVLDVAIPPACAIRISARAADDVVALRTAPWRAQPPLVPRAIGAELPWLARRESQPMQCERGSRELLLQGVRGRYAQLRIELAGNGLTTPRIGALRIWYPRFDYLRYLPACWREDPVAADFLERFLANVEGLFTSWEDRLAAVQMLFDARTTPRESLPWLAGWLGLLLDPQLDERRRRLLVRYGHRLLARRGTLPALQRLVRIATDPCVDPSIFDDDAPLPERPGDVRYLERPSGAAHTLIVRVPVRRSAADYAARLTTVRDVLAIALPAHVAGSVETVDYAFRLGSARVGFETQLAADDPIAAVIVDQSTLGMARLAAPPEGVERWALDRDRLGFLGVLS
ncbi:phage tail protein [Niveibacterium sp. 24ML]|uniref:phage tail protein n=1 Tax=Niveibacterium sp. 24ML TaxID=2985512 RepID=UPI00226D567F|nr:phage tail protein [Niveibacterium sp. 24ML]MCX9158492.1 phage tail protein [Niveibacterium sp. 24ML]